MVQEAKVDKIAFIFVSCPFYTVGPSVQKVVNSCLEGERRIAEFEVRLGRDHFEEIEDFLERFPDEDDRIIKYSNSTPHILLLDMFKPFNMHKWSIIKDMTPIHKLAYKRTKEEMLRKGTYYDVIINQYKI